VQAHSFVQYVGGAQQEGASGIDAAAALAAADLASEVIGRAAKPA